MQVLREVDAEDVDVELVWRQFAVGDGRDETFHTRRKHRQDEENADHAVAARGGAS